MGEVSHPHSEDGLCHQCIAMAHYLIQLCNLEAVSLTISGFSSFHLQPTANRNSKMMGYIPLEFLIANL